MQSSDSDLQQQILAAVQAVGPALRARLWGRYRQIAEAVVDEAPGILFLKLRLLQLYKDRNINGLAYRILFNEIVDRIRDENRGEGLVPPPRPPESDPWPLEQMPMSLPKQDVDMIIEWHNPGMQVVALVQSGLWCRIGGDTWQDILRSAEVEGDFPPPEWTEAATSQDEKKDRNRALAVVLNVAMNTVHVWWKRGRIKLQALPSIRRNWEERK